LGKSFIFFGIRRNELVNLKITDIDSKRMMKRKLRPQGANKESLHPTFTFHYWKDLREYYNNTNQKSTSLKVFTENNIQDKAWKIVLNAAAKSRHEDQPNLRALQHHSY